MDYFGRVRCKYAINEQTKGVMLYNNTSVGVWRSLVARTVRDGEVVRSNRITPTMKLFLNWQHSILAALVLRYALARQNGHQ